MLCEGQPGRHEPVCPGVCGLEDGADSRGMKAKTHVIIFQVGFALHDAEPGVRGEYLNK